MEEVVELVKSKHQPGQHDQSKHAGSRGKKGGAGGEFRTGGGPAKKPTTAMKPGMTNPVDASKGIAKRHPGVKAEKVGSNRVLITRTARPSHPGMTRSATIEGTEHGYHMTRMSAATGPVDDKLYDAYDEAETAAVKWVR